MNKILLFYVAFKLLKDKVQNLSCCDFFVILVNKFHLFISIVRQNNIDLVGVLIFIKNLIILFFVLNCIPILYSLYFGGVFGFIVKLSSCSVVLFVLLSLGGLIFDLIKVELKYLLLSCIYISITPPNNLQAIILLISNPSKIS